MNPDKAIIYIVDDDPSVRKSLKRLLSTSGYNVETFLDADEFLETELHGLLDIVLGLVVDLLNGIRALLPL